MTGPVLEGGQSDPHKAIVTENQPSSQIIHHHYTTQQDNSTFPTSVVLNESNYTIWAPLMKMRIGARGKVGYLTGAKAEPAMNSAEYEAWATDNEKVKSWLIDSMESSLMNRYIRLPTAKDIWEAVEKTFYDDSDETRIFELNKKCFEAKQNRRPIPTYYNELVAMFQEIDQRVASQNDNVAAVVQETSAMSRLRVHMFLSGLDSEYDQVRGEILRKEPKFSLEQSYAYIRKVQSERQAMGRSVPTESSIMVVQRKQGPPPGFSGPPQRRPLSKPSPYANTKCILCGEKGHSKERCYEVIGYPDWWDFTKKPRKNLDKAVVATTEEEHLDNASANVAQSGMKGKVTLNNTWIIDTGASDHMTNDPNLVTKLKHSSQNVVSTADGTPTSVTGEGSVVLSNNLTLESVLVVPSLAYNLLSVGQIILALACIVTFYPSFCVFQDILTRRILGYGIRRGKLYYLDLTENGEKQKHFLGQANQINGVENAKEAVWLWHRRLGHLSFSYLKKLQPHLFRLSTIQISIVTFVNWLRATVFHIHQVLIKVMFLL
ncbi:hypothetical protein M0R45_032528 [Rubus argutus]|uniref:CCHC-type domain-containing protein n=1 Tax=Rubus argutus TaxID=59490 RepID=A0AAW1WJQ3_RUBAR